MKKVIFVLFILAAVSPVFAQNIVNEHNNIYCFNVRIEKIYPSSQGYVIQYQRGTGGFGTVGIPNEWFLGRGTPSEPEPGPAAVGLQYVAAGRAEIIILPPGDNWPSLSIFYVDGEFSHVRLYVHRLKSHQTWGNIPQGSNVSRFFAEDRSTLNIQY
jgi:hypothetical protein